jgi:hypothetical protein
MAASCEHYKKPSGSIICGEFLSSWSSDGFSRIIQLHGDSILPYILSVFWIKFPTHLTCSVLLLRNVEKSKLWRSGPHCISSFQVSWLKIWNWKHSYTEIAWWSHKSDISFKNGKDKIVLLCFWVISVAREVAPAAHPHAILKCGWRKLRNKLTISIFNRWHLTVDKEVCGWTRHSYKVRYLVESIRTEKWMR